MPHIVRCTLRRLRMRLIRPYRLSYRTFTEFEPFVVEIADSSGREGFADAHISPGSSSETREGGWSFLIERIGEFLGMDSEAAKERVLMHFEASKAASTCLVSAIEVMERHPSLSV